MIPGLRKFNDRWFAFPDHPLMNRDHGQCDPVTRTALDALRDVVARKIGSDLSKWTDEQGRQLHLLDRYGAEKYAVQAHAWLNGGSE